MYHNLIYGLLISIAFPLSVMSWVTFAFSCGCQNSLYVLYLLCTKYVLVWPIVDSKGHFALKLIDLCAFSKTIVLQFEADISCHRSNQVTIECVL